MPDLRIASSQTEAERQAKAAREEALGALRVLTANLIRIARGAGKGYEVEAQVMEFVVALRDHHELTGIGLSSFDISQALSVGEEVVGKGYGKDLEWALGREQCIAGALQVAASRLLGQRTQETRGESELFAGVRGIERYREEQRKERFAADRAAVAAKTTKRAKRPAKAKSGKLSGK